VLRKCSAVVVIFDGNPGRASPDVSLPTQVNLSRPAGFARR
jgi:hypothetical protein